jgi:hypothetical protein
VRISALALVLLVGTMLLISCGGPKSGQQAESPKAPPPSSAPPTPQPSAPPPSPPPPPSVSTNPVAIVETSMGTFKIELFADKAPHTVQNFIELVNRGFYKNMIFHRVVAGFVIQTGDPTGTGRGGSERSIKLEIHPDLKHDRAGIVGMARSQDPDSATSQFYITPRPRSAP